MSLRHADHPGLVLASASPRRASLLRDAGFAFVVVRPPLDDAALCPGATSARAWVAALAHLKADATRRALPSDVANRAIVLGADTVVVKDGEIIGQPTDAAHARAILERLSGGSHTVLTGVALLVPRAPREIFAESAGVRVGRIEDGAIAQYIGSGAWAGKAGAYNLEERVAAGWPIEHEGDPTTVMGLPMRALIPRLRSALASIAAGEAVTP